MLKSMITIHDKIDVTKCNELEAFLKRQSKGYEPKKSKVLTQDEVIKFLKEASDAAYLVHKVIYLLYFVDCLF